MCRGRACRMGCRSRCSDSDSDDGVTVMMQRSRRCCDCAAATATLRLRCSNSIQSNRVTWSSQRRHEARVVLSHCRVADGTMCRPHCMVLTLALPQDASQAQAADAQEPPEPPTPFSPSPSPTPRSPVTPQLAAPGPSRSSLCSHRSSRSLSFTA